LGSGVTSLRAGTNVPACGYKWLRFLGCSECPAPPTCRAGGLEGEECRNCFDAVEPLLTMAGDSLETVWPGYCLTGSRTGRQARLMVDGALACRHGGFGCPWRFSMKAVGLVGLAGLALLLNDCTEPRCGDGIKDDDEQCDDGSNGDNCDGCLDNCTAHTNACGDNYECGGEQCDDGVESSTCDADCTAVHMR
jgi:hypothetical protein